VSPVPRDLSKTVSANTAPINGTFKVNSGMHGHIGSGMLSSLLKSEASSAVTSFSQWLEHVASVPGWVSKGNHPCRVSVTRWRERRKLQGVGWIQWFSKVWVYLAATSWSEFCIRTQDVKEVVVRWWRLTHSWHQLGPCSARRNHSSWIYSKIGINPRRTILEAVLTW